MNSTGDEQKKLDVLSNEMFVNSLYNSHACAILVSEENEDPIIIPEHMAGELICCGLSCCCATLCYCFKFDANGLTCGVQVKVVALVRLHSTAIHFELPFLSPSLFSPTTCTTHCPLAHHSHPHFHSLSFSPSVTPPSLQASTAWPSIPWMARPTSTATSPPEPSSQCGRRLVAV